MSKISAYDAATTVDGADLLIAVDVSDTTMAASGTDKKVTVSQLRPPHQFWVDDVAYGAAGDGKIITDVVTNTTTTITSATAAFTAGDVGKYIMINGANGSTVAPLLSTIASVTNSTTAVLADAAAASVSDCQAVYGTDDTAAINAAVSAASTYAQAGNYFAEVLFGANIYILGTGPTQSGNGSSTPTFNTQIPVPYPDADGSSRKLVIALTGAGINDHFQFWQSTAPNLAGTCLVSMLTCSSTPDATFGLQSVIGGPSGSAGYTPGFANTKVSVTGIMAVCPVLTNLTAFDFSYLAGMHMDGCAANVFAPATLGTQPRMTDLLGLGAFGSTAGVGLRAPVDTNNDDVTVPSYSCEGYLVGLRVQDHFAGGRIACLYNDVALRITCDGPSGVSHAVTISNFSAEQYAGGILLGGSYITVYINMDSETSSPTYDISDNSVIAYGRIEWSDTNNRAPTVVGGGNLKIVNNRLGPGHWAGAPSVPSSTVAQQNTSWRDAAVTVTGGTVSSVSVDGTAQGYAATGFTVIVPAGKNITLTYSSAPSWVWTLL